MGFGKIMGLAAAALLLVALVPADSRAGGVHFGFGHPVSFGHHHRHGFHGHHYRRPYHGHFRHRHGHHYPHFVYRTPGRDFRYTRRHVYRDNPESAQAPTEPTPLVPPKDAVAHDRSHCREYSRTAVIGGREQEVFGTACRQPDGRWRIVN